MGSKCTGSTASARTSGEYAIASVLSETIARTQRCSGPDHAADGNGRLWLAIDGCRWRAGLWTGQLTRWVWRKCYFGLDLEHGSNRRASSCLSRHSCSRRPGTDGFQMGHALTGPRLGLRVTDPAGGPVARGVGPARGVGLKALMYSG